jgi:hypothetical protein
MAIYLIYFPRYPITCGYTEQVTQILERSTWESRSSWIKQIAYNNYNPLRRYFEPEWNKQMALERIFNDELHSLYSPRILGILK